MIGSIAVVRGAASLVVFFLIQYIILKVKNSYAVLILSIPFTEGGQHRLLFLSAGVSSMFSPPPVLLDVLS